MDGETRVFVYGTLRRGEPNHRILDGRISAVRQGALGGYALYGRDWSFPYITPARPDYQVHGELVVLRPPTAPGTLARLDQLEGYREGSVSNHYDRVALPIFPVGETAAVTAWVYVAGRDYRRRLTPDQLIPSGDWLTRAGRPRKRWADSRGRITAQSPRPKTWA